jgi:predicted metal-dependent enzyme (double-stranded beta helix superfamily)
MPSRIANARSAELRTFSEAVDPFVGTADTSRDSLRSIEAAMKVLAAHTELFPEEHFQRPGNEPGALFELWVNEAGTAALYYNVIWDDIDSPAHRHGTWAAIAGLESVEPNQTYRLDPETDAPIPAERIEVTPGIAVSMLPTDVHSIHVHGPFPVRTLHFYGRSLATAGLRELYDPDLKKWETYPAQVTVLQPSVV